MSSIERRFEKFKNREELKQELPERLSEEEKLERIEKELRKKIREWVKEKKEAVTLKRFFKKGESGALRSKNIELKYVADIYTKFRLKKESLKEWSKDYAKRYEELIEETEKRKENALKEEEKERPIRTHTNFGREVVENLELKPGEIFVDVGCGVGLATMMAGQENVKTIGIDFNKENVKFANTLTKLTELIFLDRETAENFSSIIGEESEKWKSDKELFGKGMELSEKVKKSPELSLKEKEKMKNEILDLMPYIFDLYDFYLDLKWKDPYLDEKLEKTELPENVSFLQGDAVHLSLKSNSADKILSADVIHWIPEENQKKALEEILRIAKSGALLEVFYDFGPNLEKVAEEKNVNLEQIGRKRVGVGKGLGTRPIYRVIKPEEKL